MIKEIKDYHNAKTDSEKAICEKLYQEITAVLGEMETKLWHAHPVWFLDGNPIAGYDTLKDCVRLMFWSGQSFDEPGLAKTGTFKAAEARYTDIEQINSEDLNKWLEKSKNIQWDYKNIVKKKGQLDRLKLA